MDDVRDTPTPLSNALGLLVARVSALEATLAEWIIRSACENGVDHESARKKAVGRSGQRVVNELADSGRADFADEYHLINEQRNHLVHGNGWQLPGIGYHVIHQRPGGHAVERLWQPDEILRLSHQVMALEQRVRREVERDGYQMAHSSVTGPIREPWEPQSRGQQLSQPHNRSTTPL